MVATSSYFANLSKRVNSVARASLISRLRGFVGLHQLAALSEALRGEEASSFAAKLRELASLIAAMPETRGSDPRDPIVYLHYFGPQGDWYVTEKDAGCEGDAPEQFQTQAYGFAARRSIAEGKFAYINIRELIAHGVELDLYWTPKPLSVVREGGGND